MRITLLAPTLLAGLWFLVGCEAQVPPVSPPSYGEETDTAMVDPAAPASEPVQLAENLLATNYLILLDNSGSMDSAECSNGRDKFSVAKEAIVSFVEALPRDSNVALMDFGHRGGNLLLPFASVETVRAEIAAAMPGRTGGQGTPLKQSLWDATDYMSKQAERQLWYGTYRLVIVTDGASGDGDPGSLAMEVVEKKPIEIHAIGFCLGEGHSLELPGYTAYYSAMDPASLGAALESVKAEVESFDGDFSEL